MESGKLKRARGAGGIYDTLRYLKLFINNNSQCTEMYVRCRILYSWCKSTRRVHGTLDFTFTLN